MAFCFAKRRSHQRAIALIAAYAIALSGLIASVVTARAAADALAGPVAILCHDTTTGETTPAADGVNGKICVDNCCIGCLMLTAAVPPPPAISITARSTPVRFAPLRRFSLGSGPQAKSNRSRAPPRTV